jgi:LuxR family quorum-sensing transcriptional regulator LasR
MNGASLPASHSHLSSVDQIIINLANCETENNLEIELEKIIDLINFDLYYYSGSFGFINNNDIRRTLSNIPPAGPETAKAIGAESMKSDPFTQFAHHRTTPMIWDHPGDTPEAASVLDRSIGGGVIFPIHGKSGDTAVLGVFMRNDERKKKRSSILSVAEICLTATYLHEAMSRIIAKSHYTPKAPLTRREIECLQLIANYKSNWVISRILGISEHGVVYYVRRLMWKLDAQNRYQAVERAAAYGLI